jgi:hypothetical protein
VNSAALWCCSLQLRGPCMHAVLMLADACYTSRMAAAVDVATVCCSWLTQVAAAHCSDTP